MPPPLVVIVTWPGWPNSALFNAPSARSSEIDSVEGNASGIGLLPVALWIVIPSIETSVWDGSPPCSENSPWSLCTPGNVPMMFSALVPVALARVLTGRLAAATAPYTALIEAVSVSMVEIVSPETWTSCCTLPTVKATSRRSCCRAARPMFVAEYFSKPGKAISTVYFEAFTSMN